MRVCLRCLYSCRGTQDTFPDGPGRSRAGAVSLPLAAANRDIGSTPCRCLQNERGRQLRRPYFATGCRVCQVVFQHVCDGYLLYPMLPQIQPAPLGPIPRASTMS
jgi:hypothetical protein